MSIKHHRFLPSQFTGPLLNSFAHAVEAEFADARTIEEYLYGLSIDTAKDTELESIGCLIGYPRPLVPDSFATENLLILKNPPIEYDANAGIGEVGSPVGGKLATLETSKGNYLALGYYRKLLKQVAYIKRFGITLESVDAIVQTVDTQYTITFDENNDIEVVFDRYIGYQNVWLLTELFYRLATEPQVLISSGEE